jgi:hypothetical protein
MKTSFKKATQPETVIQAEVADAPETPVTPVTSEVAAIEERQVSTEVAVGSIGGEIDKSDIRYPALKLAQAVGDLMNVYNRPPGELVLKNEISLWLPNQTPVSPAVNISVLKAEKVFIEDKPYGSEEFPKIFKTKEAADAAGFRTEWLDGEKPEVYPSLQTVVLIQGDAKTQELPEFYVELGGKKYALAVWNIGGTSYKAAAVDIISESRSSLRVSGLHSGIFALSAIKVVGAKFAYWNPRVKLIGKHSPEVAAQIAALV